MSCEAVLRENGEPPEKRERVGRDRGLLFLSQKLLGSLPDGEYHLQLKIGAYVARLIFIRIEGSVPSVDEVEFEMDVALEKVTNELRNRKDDRNSSN